MSAKETVSQATEVRPDPVFIDGYFTQRLKAGDRPDYGYPENHLPQTTRPGMTIRTSFLSSRHAPKEE